MSATFKFLSELFEKVEATKKRLEIIDQTANYLKTLNQQELRISRVRDDKIPQEADTIQKVKEVYEKQLHKKGKYKTD